MEGHASIACPWLEDEDASQIVIRLLSKVISCRIVLM
jgi:hypothetical protein